jgi:hypothetical protein
MNKDGISIVHINTIPYLVPAWNDKKIFPKNYSKPYTIHSNPYYQQYNQHQLKLRKQVDYSQNLPETFIRSNCISLILFGIIMVLMQIGQIVVSSFYIDYNAYYYTVASGIWSGIYLIATASISIHTGILISIKSCSNILSLYFYS